MKCSFLKKSLTRSQPKAFLGTIDDATSLQGTISVAERLKVLEILKDLDKVRPCEHYWIFIFALMNAKLGCLPTQDLNKIKLVNIPIYIKEGHMSLHP